MSTVADWTVDYGDGRGPHPVTLPHAWRQELAVALEGPALYAAELSVPPEGGWLCFDGVSYAASVRIDGVEVARHEGLWDAFSAPLAEFAGRTVRLEVEVTKHGGPSHPVATSASGFLPYVFHTFGGIHGEVRLVPGEGDPLAHPPGAPPARIAVDGTRLTLDGAPFYLRGLLHWGWYPELGHTNPPEAVMRRELEAARKLGFNTVKFCLWVPPHRYFELLEEYGMVAWLELPLWNPADDEAVRRRLAAELERIVRQYRRHGSIVAWSLGCELGGSVPAEFRRRLAGLVRSLTGCPLVTDSSGGAEMYGGDPREFGAFYDFHPYCDLPFFPPVLDSLLPGPRARRPTLLGEFNDFDAHRDLPRLLEDHPYWASALPEFNDLGVRWQHELPRVLRSNRFAHEPRTNRHARLMASSLSKGRFVRQTALDAVRARGELGGYVITGWRDTPISSSGMFDDWGAARFEAVDWNGPDALFLAPPRRPPWNAGGNRPGYLDPYNVWPGNLLWKLCVHSERGLTAGGFWRLLGPAGESVAEGSLEMTAVEPLAPTQVGEAFAELVAAGDYALEAEFGPLRRRWRISAIEPPALAGTLAVEPGELDACADAFGAKVVGLDAFDWQEGVAVLTARGASPAPFWRECAFEFEDAEFWGRLGLEDAWDRLLPICGDRALDLAWLGERTGREPEVLLRRIDTRTYAETAILARCGRVYATTLRPFGGLGSQPPNLRSNPSGAALLQRLFEA